MKRSATTANILPLALIVSVVAGCGLVPSPTPVGRPSDAVRAAIERMVARDLAGAQEFVCKANQDPTELPLVIAAMFSPLADLPALPNSQALQAIDIDTRDLIIEDLRGDLRDAVEWDVELRGALWLSVDRDEVEAAVRAGPRIEPGPIDEARLAESLAKVPEGPQWQFVGQSIRVVHEDGEWRVCEPRPPG